MQSVFFLQNEPAKIKWPVTNESIDELKLAFSINPEEQSLNLIKTKVKFDSSTKKHRHNEVTKEIVPLEKQTNSTKLLPKKRRQKTPKQSQKKKKLVDESGTKELEILASLGIPSHKGNKENHGRKAGLHNTVDITKSTAKRNKKNRKKNR